MFINIKSYLSKINLPNKFIGYLRPCDIITLVGTLISFLGIALVVSHYYVYAAICLAISGICDGIDGKVARNHTYDKDKKFYGTELDSLSDVICFGVFPAIFTCTICHNIVGYVVSIFYLVCGITRLAYFNMLSVTKKNKDNTFIGVPITTISIIYPILILILKCFDYSLVNIILPIVMALMGISFILKIEIKKVDIVGILLKIFNKYTVNFIFFPLFLVLASDLFYKISFNKDIIASVVYMLNTVFDHFLPFIYIVLIVSLVMVVLTCLFKNPKWAKIILLVLVLVFLIINDIKYHIMDLPIQISDVNYLNPDNMEMMGGATSSIGIWILFTLIKSLIFVLIGIFIIRKYNNLNLSIIKRIIFGVIGLSLLIVIICHFNFSNDFKISKIYNTNTDNLLKISDTAKLYNDYGLFQGLYLDDLANLYLEPESYNKKKAKSILNNATNDSDINWGKANVVVMLSETFSDAENIEEVTFNQNLTSNLDMYSKDDDKMVFDLLVSTYGGTSVNSEFEVLTGGSLHFFKKNFIPYTQYFNEENSKYVPSLIREFNNNNYNTMYLTPWGKTSFKSEYVYTLYGADEMIYGDSLSGKKKGIYYSDKSLMDDIFNELKDTSKGNYKFIMTATAQNHFPYGNKYKETDYDVSVEKTSLNKEQTALMRSYAQGIYDADKYLNYLYEKIKTLNTPTIIVFFGDHLPYMIDSKGNNVYLSSSYFNTKDDNLNELRKYTTKAAILANYDIDTSDDLEYINAGYLGAYLVNKMDLDVSNYFKYVDSARKITPVFNRNVIYDIENKNIIDIDDANKLQQKNLNNYKNVQHYSFYDGK